MRKLASLGLGMSVVALWIGCGGSESSSPNNTGGTDSGSEGSTTDTGTPDTSKPLDAAFDGFINAPEITLTFGTCPTFTACGGDEKGSWKVSGGCLSDSLLDDGKAACPGLTTSNEVIKGKGTVDADGANIVRHTSVNLKAKAFVPFTGQCAGAKNLGGCPALGTLGAAQLGFDKMTCVDATDAGADGGCNCDVETTVVDNTTDTYTKSGNTITTGAGDTFDYCVAAPKLTYTQTNGQNPLPLFIELTK